MKIRAPYDDINFTPPKGCREEAAKGIEWHEEGHSGDGLMPATVRWARRLAAGQDITPDKARKMRAWLARHESDKDGEGFRPGEKGFPSPGRVAWALWCGDPGVAWSNKLVKQMEAADREKQIANQEGEKVSKDNKMIRKLYKYKSSYMDDDEDPKVMDHEDDHEEDKYTYVVASAPTPDRYNDIVDSD